MHTNTNIDEGHTLTYNGLLFFKLLFGWRVVSLALTPHLPISIEVAQSD